MKDLTAQQVNEIAQEMDMGFRCYFHRETGELICVPDEFRHPDFDTEAWDADIEKVSSDYYSYLVFEPLESWESFAIMEGFAEQVANKRLKGELLIALSQKKPFSHFKWIVDNASDYRQEWFDYKQARLEERVKDQFELARRTEERSADEAE